MRTPFRALVPALALLFAAACGDRPERSEGGGAAAAPVLKIHRLDPEMRVVVDGSFADLCWQQIEELRVPLQGKGASEVRLKAASDGEFFYLLALWPDEAVSTNRYWEYVALGKWRKHTGEDAFSICWSPGGLDRAFREQGCALFCHGGKHVQPGKEYVDFWYWGVQQTGRKYTLRDMWLPAGDKQRLRGDSQPEGSDNLPNFSEEYGEEGGPWGVPKRVGPNRSVFYLDASNAQPLPLKQLKENLDLKRNLGWKVALDIQRPIKGSRGDVAARGRHLGKVWVLEMRRRLETGNNDDQPLRDAGVSYFCSVAVHDGTDGDAHAISAPIELRFVDMR